MFGPVGLRIHIHAIGAGPDAGEGRERPEIRQCVGIQLGFGEDVRGILVHERSGGALS